MTCFFLLTVGIVSETYAGNNLKKDPAGMAFFVLVHRSMSHGRFALQPCWAQCVIIPQLSFPQFCKDVSTIL